MLKPSFVGKNVVNGFSQIHPGITISKSPIHGNGIFTKTGLSTGTLVFDVVAEKAYCENNPELARINQNWIGAGLNRWLKVQPGDIGSFINHSCRPNIIMDETFRFYTIRQVNPNEELLLDYSTTELDPFWELNCDCGTRECRKLIRSFQFLPTGLKIKYLQHLPLSFKHEAELVSSNQEFLHSKFRLTSLSL